MIVQRKSTERRHIKSGTCDMWLTFYPEENADAVGDSFGTIAVFNEFMLPLHESVVSELVRETELVTYVHKGALALENQAGYSRVVTAGEFQCMTVIRVGKERVTSASTADTTHFFLIYLRLTSQPTGIVSNEEPVRITSAQRRNVLCPVMTPNTRKTLHSTSDARLYSSILDPGRHIVHELTPGRKAWLHIVYGTVTANEVDLSTGDGMGITDEPGVSITVIKTTELLLVDTLPQ
ncbi:MAG: hypothetical protein JW863_09780 [Chitinispirillaceae bacterium]|nr:hypothetical protein [Chitinispirillaceae bacterium]